MIKTILIVEKDLNRLIGWTVGAALVKPGKRGARRTRAHSPRRGVAWRGEPDVREWIPFVGYGN